MAPAPASPSAPRICFQASLPRSGSTLFSNLVGQNPAFHVTPTSGLLDLLYAARGAFTKGDEFRAQDPQLMERAFAGFCRGGLEGWCAGLTDRPWVLDKSRGWGILYGFLHAFYPDPRIVCLVRDPVDIFASMEKNFRRSDLRDSGIVNHAGLVCTTVEKRVDHWVATPPVGLALERLQEILRMGIAEKMLFIQFENLCRRPGRELERFYAFLGLEPHPGHDFDNVEQITQEDDSVYGVFGDHRIRRRVEPVASNAEALLGAPLCDWIRQRYAWFYNHFPTAAP